MWTPVQSLKKISELKLGDFKQTFQIFTTKCNFLKFATVFQSTIKHVFFM